MAHRGGRLHTHRSKLNSATARATAAAVIAVLVTAISAGPADAHASLITSDPNDGSVLAAVPNTIKLTFSEPIELNLSRFELQRPDGSHLSLGSPTMAAGKSNVVIVPISRLPTGSYIVTWHAATRDTHIATGQILFAMGTGIVGGLKNAPGSSLHVLAWVAGAGRFGWYLVLALTTGLLFGLAWGLQGETGAPPDAAHGEFRRLVLRWLKALAPVLVAMTLLRLALLLLQAVTNATGSTMSAIVDQLGSYQGRLWSALIVVSAVTAGLLRWLVRTTDSVEAHRARSRRLFPAVIATMAAMTVFETASGHAATRRAPLVAVLITAVHLSSVAVWVGSLSAFALISASKPYRQVPARQRSQLRQELLRRFSPVATLALAGLVASGLWLGAVNLGPVAKTFSTTYGLTLAAKVCLLGVAATLGFLHRRMLGKGRSRRAPHLGRRPPAPAESGRLSWLTVPAEAAILVATLTLAAGLTGLQPAGQVIAYRAAQSKANLVVARPEDCERTPAFVLGCWQRYFDAAVRTKGADTAMGDLQALSTTGPFANGQCHQLAHVVGRAASRRYSLADGLKQGQHLGDICFSGYFHGLLEGYTSTLTDVQLRSSLNTICVVAGVKRYSFDNYTCIHGLGHGITLRYSDDVFKALPWCNQMTDTWDQESCFSGVFMQNIIADQIEGGAVDIKANDPIYPCNAVTQTQKHACYQMVTSNILKQVNWDYRSGFLACDKVESAFRSTCYESMGRDISGAALLDPAKTLQLCSLATNPAAEQSCIGAAAENAVSTDHNGTKASALCAAAPPSFQPGCLKARDQLVSQL